jgi:hypothetical protein
MNFLKNFIITIFLLIVSSAWAFDTSHDSKQQASKVNSIEYFLREIYSQYHLNGEGGINIFDTQPNNFVSPSLFKLIQQDNLLLEGEAGDVDADPICACQDHDKLKITKITINQKNSQTAAATVYFKNLDTETRVDFSLLKVNGNWRIDDIGNEGMPSLRLTLEHEIQKLSVHH